MGTVSWQEILLGDSKNNSWKRIGCSVPKLRVKIEMKGRLDREGKTKDDARVYRLSCWRK